jgi:hypothetical protein
LEEQDIDCKTLRNMETGQRVVFKGCVKRNSENKFWMADIWNIRPAEEFYANR